MTSKCLQCNKPNPPSKSNRPRKYCSKKCANDYLHNLKKMEHPRYNDPTWKKAKLKRDIEIKKRLELYRWHEENSHTLSSIAKMAGISPSAVHVRKKRLGIKGFLISLPGGGQALFFNDEDANIIAHRYFEFDLKPLKKRFLTEKQKNKKRTRDRHRLRKLRKDPVFRLRNNVGGAVYNALKKQGRTKTGSTFAALPYTPKQLAEHIEKQFDENMSWENMGSYWHLDHIIPQAALPYDSFEHPNFAKCWALSNLRPLNRIENISKGSLYKGKRHKYKKK